MVQHALNTQIKVDEMEQQRKNIFYASCHVKYKVCSLIIFGESCTNVASITLFEKLGLHMLKNPRPCKLQWLNECGKDMVKKQVFVSFTIGKYSEEVTCDVVPMHAGHILLGRPGIMIGR